jgi:hypothetical protein
MLIANSAAAMDATIPDGQPDRDAPDLDPLQDFFAELETTTLQVPDPKQDSPAGSADAEIVSDPDQAARLARAERLLERTVIEVSGLKSDLATLVSVIDDIKKRQSQRSPLPAARSGRLPARLSATGTAVTAVVLMVTGFTIWGVYAVASYDVSEPPPIESVPDPVEEEAAPMTTAAAPAAQIQPAVAIATVLPASDAPSFDASARDAPARDAPARDAPARAAPARPAPPPTESAPRRAISYVGTLTVDASPAGEVFLNRKSVGRTPVRLEKLRAGSHLIWIERDGYRRWTRVVPVTADRVSRVSAELDPLNR